MKSTKKTLLLSTISLVVCIAMLVGTTFAWFTDVVTSSKNIITSGNVDLEMYWTDDLDSGVWHNVENKKYNTIFSYDNWEPGYTEVKYIKLVNAGSLALNYKLAITPTGDVGKLAEVINVFYAQDGVKVQSRDQLDKLGCIGLLNNVMDGRRVAQGTLLADDQYNPNHDAGETIITLAMNMITTAGNEYQSQSIGDGFTITALATQCPYEKDSFGSDYDSAAKYPAIIKPGKVSATVEPVDGKVPAGGLTIAGESYTATVPAGVALKDNVSQLDFSVTPLKNTSTDITVVNNEILIPVDVHIDGVAEDNTVPIIVDLGEVLPKYLNMGNYRLFHVEDGQNMEMTLVDDRADLTAHNTFTYDPVTGEVSVAMATFSEVALVADTAAGWEGEYDYDWYDASKTEFTIANADQLAAFGAIVGGMNGQTRDSFEGDTVKLLADVNLNDGEEENGNHIFYPIGYYYNGDSSAPSSTVYSFEGTFDGMGHTISNFYQNTWEIKGDYDANYYKDAMGLFGYVVNGTIKNLTVNNFDSDGEFTPTGVIAAYAVNSTFENLAITNCNPRVYNTGNGGIVGIGGNSDDDANKNLNFTNITVDQSNVISALWGSWDVACGGIMGMFRGNSNVKFLNCHMSAQIDVYNDVCGNYQYYWYRYSGMMIGSIRGKNITDSEGYTVPDLTGISAEGCTIKFGEWNDYYYCELVANSLASYTHDHQFSRLEKISGLSAIQDDKGNWKKTGNFVIVAQDGKTTCYHIVKDENGNLKQHKHEDADEETVDGQTVLKEDKQRVLLNFNQIFQGDGWGVKHVPISTEEGSNLKNVKPEYANLDISVLNNDTKEKFETKFTEDILYRVGNKNTVPVGDLFKAIDENSINDTGVYVTIDKYDENSLASGTFTKSTTENWEDGTVQFTGTGIVKVTIQDYYYCKPTTIIVEVVNGYNVSAVGGEWALKNRTSVFTSDVKMATNGNIWIENATLYGNGFTFDVTAGKDGNTESGYIGGNYAVALKNATLDNIKIVGEVYTKYGATAKSEYNYPTILTNGNTVIANSYVSNGSSAIRAQDGDLQIINSTLEGGIFANLDIRGGTVTLDNVTTINQSTADGESTSNENGIVGLGIVFYECNLSAKLHVKTDANGNPKLYQYNHISENTKFKDSVANQLREAMFKTEHQELQYTDANGVVWINPCILSITDGIGVDNIDNIKGYTGKVASIATYKGYVYTAVPTKIDYKQEYKSVGQYHILPTVVFDHENEKNYVAPSTGSNEHCYFNSDTQQLEISFDQGKNKVYDPNILSVSKTGKNVNYTVKIDGVDYTGKTITFDKSGTYKAVYTYTDPYNFKLTNGKIENFDVSYEKSVTIVVSAVAAAAKDAKFTFYGYSGISKDAATTITDVKTVTSSSGNLYIMPSTTGSYVTSKTIDGITVNCPRVYVDFKDNSSDFNWLYPIFLGVKIDDYANGGTADTATTIVSPTSTSKPANLTILTVDKPSGGGGWSSGSGKSGSEGKISSGTYKNLYGWTSGALGSDQPANSIYCQFTYKDNKGTTYYYVIEFYRAAHDCPSLCVTPDTLITLADGSKVRIDSLKGNEELLVWNHETGKLEKTPVAYIVNHDGVISEREIIHLNFANGKTVKMIGEHVFFDATLNKYVAITSENANDFIGHTFVALAADGMSVEKVVLESLEREIAETGVYEVVSYKHLTCFTEGILSTSAYLDPLLNVFDVSSETLAYDMESVMKDVEEYGLYTYDDFDGLISEEAFELYNAKYLKIAVGKGYIDWNDILGLIDIYFNVDVNPIQ